MRLVTWNVLHGAPPDHGPVDLDAVTRAVTDLDADVLALQELDRDQPRSGGHDVLALAAEAMGATASRFVPALVGEPGGAWRAATDADDAAGGEPSYGIGLASRHPVRSWHVLRLRPAPVRAPVLLPPAAGQRVLWLRDEPRVVIAAVVDGPYGVVTVACTHLSFVPGWNTAQLRRVSRWLRSLPAPRLLLGDLNVPARVAMAVTGWSALGRLPTYPTQRPRVQLDHVLADEFVRPVLAVATPVLPVSDHRPLLVTV